MERVKDGVMRRGGTRKRGVDNEGEGSEPEKIHETRSLGQEYSHKHGGGRVMEKSTN